LVEENQHKMVSKCGQTGTGKSYSCLAQADLMLGDNFDPIKHVAYFDSWDFIKKLDKSKPGEILLFDDAGVGMDSREWYKKSNILIRHIFQVFRTRNLFIFMTTPDFSYVDIGNRKRFHNFVEMKRIDKKREETIGKWYDIWTDAWSGKFGRATMKMFVGDRFASISEIRTPRLNQDIADIYEEQRAKAEGKTMKEAVEFERGNERTITVEQASKMLNMKSQTLWWLIGKGNIPIVKESARIKLDLAIIKDYIKKLRLNPHKRVEYTKKEFIKDDANIIDKLELSDGLYLFSRFDDDEDYNINSFGD